MATQKTKTSSFLSWPGRHKIISFFVALILVVISYFVYQAVTLQINKRNFQQARTAIDTVYADIVSQVGQPDNYKRTSTCSHSYQEFTGYGPPTCDVGFDFTYSVNNEAEANVNFKRMQVIISKHGIFKPEKKLSSSITSELVVNTKYTDVQDFYKIGALNCSAKYVYNTPDETYLRLLHSSSKTFYVTIGCSGSARSQYYPLAY